ncbi:MAG: alpha/beta hydrolase [Acidobacteria bacterium]|nr:MAG: alpha/beta hydrolase [Acidobacteriota bacterium]
MSNNASILIRASGHTRSNRKEHSRQQALWVAACLVLLATVALAGEVAAQDRAPAQLPPTPTDVKPGSITLEDVPYPYAVLYLPMTVYGQDVRMAYMDVAPSGQPNGRTVVLLHGMNFFGEYWTGTIDVLRKQGFRVVVPDQIGFGRSSKPIIPYNFHDMALNTRKLLQHLGISKAAIVGHSMGGMLTARFAASYPDMTERAVIYNPIELTDPRWERPWRSTDEAYKQTLGLTYQQAYQGIARYFVTGWKPEYEKYVRIHYAWTLSGDWPRFAMVRTLVQQMTYLDPVVYDWPHIKVKTLVLGGDKDGANFPDRAKHIADTIPGAELVLIPNIGHVPHFEAPDLFYKALLKFLNSDAAMPMQKPANR